MIYFCSDLDNTLIYSYRYNIGDDKVLVEVKDGKELSYMSKVSHQLLQKVAKVKELVPLTTRSLEQYSRINFGSRVKIKYALTSNGGILLEDNKINEDWFRETKRIVSYAEDEMQKGIQILKKDEKVCFEIRMVDEVSVFTKSSSPQETMERLKETLDTDIVDIRNHGIKVYIFPKAIDKGCALQRFRNYVGEEHSFIAAGDSSFDVSMLMAADTAFCPENLAIPEDADKENIIKLPDNGFTEEMLQRVLCL